MLFEGSMINHTLIAALRPSHATAQNANQQQVQLGRKPRTNRYFVIVGFSFSIWPQ
jgi:hypothetical protein